MREQGIDVSFAAGNRAGGLPFLKAPTAFLSALAWLDLADNFARIVATGLIVLIDALIHLSRLNIIHPKLQRRRPPPARVYRLANGSDVVIATPVFTLRPRLPRIGNPESPDPASARVRTVRASDYVYPKFG